MDEVMERAVRYQQTKHLIPTPETSEPTARSKPALAAQAR
jgi:hypothetical protein